MDESVRDLTGDASTLIVGPDFLHFIVPRGLLEKIPFFQAGLTGEFQESSTKTFIIPEFHANAVATVLFFATAGNVGHITNASACCDFVRAYTVAYAWGMENIANSLTDELAIYYDRQILDPKLLEMLQMADLRESPLYMFFSHPIAFDCLGGEYHSADTIKERGRLKIACELLSNDDTCTILSIISGVQSKTPEQQTPDLVTRQCAWHKHTDKTDIKCQPGPSGAFWRKQNRVSGMYTPLRGLEVE